MKNVGPRNFWPVLEISEAFVIGLEVSFSDTFASWTLKVFKVWVSNFETGDSQSRKVLNLPFYTPFIIML